MSDMTTIDRILLLLKEKHIRKGEFCQDLGIPKSSFYLWKKNNNVVTSKYIVSIARYLDVSLEYLLCGEENPDLQQKNSEDNESL